MYATLFRVEVRAALTQGCFARWALLRNRYAVRETAVVGTFQPPYIAEK
jgi:hypothetical protein